MRPGKLFVIAAPSGAGKTTLVKAIINNLNDVMVSISHTTRTKRSNEVEDVNYHFITHDVFQKMIAEKAFLEYAKIFDEWYGTSRQWVERTLQLGSDVILEIDWQGHQQIKRLLPDTVSIFVLPPSLEDLQARLCGRNQDPTALIEKRFADAKETISHVGEFDYVVMNDKFEQALHDLLIIIKAERLRRDLQLKKHKDVLAKMLSAASVK